VFSSSLLVRVIFIAAAAIQVWALIDACLRPPAAYLAAGKLTKGAWVAILAVALVACQLAGYFGIIGLATIVATIVYFVDVRPAVRALTGRR
jgi:hypothetical protein